jgi:hypothetical protein
MRQPPCSGMSRGPHHFLVTATSVVGPLVVRGPPLDVTQASERRATDRHRAVWVRRSLAVVVCPRPAGHARLAMP